MNFVVRRVVVMGLVLSSTGCSYIFVTGKPPNVERLPPSEPLECTSSKVAPVLDTAFAGLEAVRTAYALSRTNADYVGQPISRGADIGFGIGSVALFATSAIYGYVKTGDCSDAKDARARARQSYPAPSGFYGLPPPTGASYPAPQAPPASFAPLPASPSQAPGPASPAVPSEPAPATPAPESSAPSNAFPPTP